MKPKYIFPDAGAQLRTLEDYIRQQMNLTDTITFEFPSILECADLALKEDTLIRLETSDTPVAVGKPSEQ